MTFVDPTSDEGLAKELYNMDMSATPGSFTPWEKQISYVHKHYRRIAGQVIKSNWYQNRILIAAYKEAVAQSKLRNGEDDGDR